MAYRLPSLVFAVLGLALLGLVAAVGGIVTLATLGTILLLAAAAVLLA
jgi:hypothetical protein